MAEEEKEGILSGTKRVCSVTKVETVDVLSEGPISGVVDIDYVFAGTAGNTGWTQATPGSSYDLRRSIYLNETPMIGKDGKYNFQDTNAKLTVGKPDGETDETYLKKAVSKTKNVSERLRGPSFDDDGGVIDIDGDGNPDIDMFAKYYRILNKDCTEIDVNIRLSVLQKTYTGTDSETQGDVQDTTVTIVIQSRALYYSSVGSITSIAGFATVSGGDITGKISGGFLKRYKLNLSDEPLEDPNFAGWEIKVYRTTKESVTIYVKDQTSVDSITDYSRSTFTYPNSATATIKFNAEYFTDVPARAYDCRLLTVKVPSNYNPLLKTYDPAVWDGTWKTDSNGKIVKQWTDNPAWCFYDLLTNKRYGLGKYIDESLVDKWSLFQIAKYCDVLVDDGYGQLEPRFSCNMLLLSREDAFKVVSDMASVFRSISYYAGGGIYTIQDAQKRTIYSFNNSNVLDGDFTYSNTSQKVRHTVALVRYNDKRNFYKPAVEYIEDIDGIRKYGIREIEVTAMGCTSRGQALRYGRWILFTENLETETVGFKVGMEGSYVRPGDVIEVYDSNRAVTRRGGRCMSISSDSNSSTFTLDHQITSLIGSQTYIIDILTPTYNYLNDITDLTSADSENLRRLAIQSFTFIGNSIGSTIDDHGETLSTVSVNKVINSTDYSIDGNPVWTVYPSGTLVASDLNEAANKPDTYRVVNVSEQTEDKTYEISAAEYDERKYRAIEEGLSFDDTSFNVLPDPPSNLQLTIKSPANTNYTKYIEYIIHPPGNEDGLFNYYVYVKKGSWVAADFADNYSGAVDPSDTTKIPNLEFRIAVLSKSSAAGQTVTGNFIPIEGGTYSFRVFSANAEGGVKGSYPKTSGNVTNVNPILDTTVKNLRLSIDTDTSNDAGKNDATLKSFKAITNPTFKWAFALLSTELNNLSSNYFYRITVRKHNSGSDTPKVGMSNILFQVTNYSPSGGDGGNIANINYTLNFSSILAMTSTEAEMRKFDVVVEAHDANNKSSSGGSFSSTTDSSFTNSGGYDIITVDNAKFLSSELHLGTEATSPHTYMQTDQVLTLEQGKVDITFGKCSLSDVRGGFIFASLSSFDIDDVEGLTTLPATIEAIRFTQNISTGSVLTALPSSAIRNASSAYIAIAFVDSLDLQRETLDSNWSETNLRASLKVSNVINIIKSADAVVDATGEGFKVWIRIGFDGKYYGRGITRVVLLDPDDDETRAITDNLYQPDSYKQYVGFRAWTCNDLNTDIEMKNDMNEVIYTTSLQHFFCGLMWSVPDKQLIDGDLGDPPEGYDTLNDIDAIKAFGGYPAGYFLKGGKTTNNMIGHKRFRCYIDQDMTGGPANKNYAIMGIRTENNPYIPFYTTMADGGGTPEKFWDSNERGTNDDDIATHTNPHQAGWQTKEEMAHMSKIIMMHHQDVGPLVLNLANTPYFGDIGGGYRHHSAGFGQGFGGLLKNERYFDVHMGWLIDDTYLTDAFFAVVQTDDNVMEDPDPNAYD